MLELNATNYTNINNAIVDHIMNLTNEKGKPLAARGSYLTIYFELQKWWNISFTKEGYKLKCLWRSVSKLATKLGYSRDVVGAACAEFEKMGILIRIDNGLNNGQHFVMLGNYETDTTKPTHAPNIRKRAEAEIARKVAFNESYVKAQEEQKVEVEMTIVETVETVDTVETKQEPKEEQVNPFAEMLTEEAILARAAKPSSSITHLIEQSVDINPFANASSPFMSTEPTVDEDYGYEANECGCGYCEVCLAEDEDYDY